MSDPSPGEEIYRRLAGCGILTILEREPGDCIRLTAPGMMDLVVDYLRKDAGTFRISLAHNGIQEGDVMADPDMEVEIRGHEAHACTYQNDYLGMYQEVENENDPLQGKLDQYLISWLARIQEVWKI